MNVYLALFLVLLLVGLLIETNLGSHLKKIGKRVYENPIVRLAMAFYYVGWLIFLVASYAIIS